MQRRVRAQAGHCASEDQGGKGEAPHGGEQACEEERSLQEAEGRARREAEGEALRQQQSALHFVPSSSFHNPPPQEKINKDEERKREEEEAAQRAAEAEIVHAPEERKPQRAADLECIKLQQQREEEAARRAEDHRRQPPSAAIAAAPILTATEGAWRRGGPPAVLLLQLLGRACTDCWCLHAPAFREPCAPRPVKALWSCRCSDGLACAIVYRLLFRMFTMPARADLPEAGRGRGSHVVRLCSWLCSWLRSCSWVFVVEETNVASAVAGTVAVFVVRCRGGCGGDRGGGNRGFGGGGNQGCSGAFPTGVLLAGGPVGHAGPSRSLPAVHVETTGDVRFAYGHMGSPIRLHSNRVSVELNQRMIYHYHCTSRPCPPFLESCN